MKLHHDSPVREHSGIRSTYNWLKQGFCWLKMKQNVTEWVHKCDTCHRYEGENVPYSGLLQPLQAPKQACSHVTMDFIEQLPRLDLCAFRSRGIL